jgi:tRNA threonylcarbamoyladenosine biosynthesis protein TsaB
MSAKILALDTSTDACSAALLINGEMTHFFEVTPQQHTAHILPMIKKLLDQAKVELNALDAVAFGFGPGSFTGIRLATSIAQGLAYGAKLPVIPISTLRALAQRAFAEFSIPSVFAAFDARMQCVYWGGYQCGQDEIMHAVVNDMIAAPEKVITPENMPLTESIGVGGGWGLYEDILSTRCQVAKVVVNYYPRAQEIAFLAEFEFARGHLVDPEQALPLYLRDEIAYQHSNNRSRFPAKPQLNILGGS